MGSMKRWPIIRHIRWYFLYTRQSFHGMDLEAEVAELERLERIWHGKE